MIKYYRVKKDNFLWKEGAIISHNTQTQNGYVPIEDIWDTTPVNENEYITKGIIEADENSEYFERVYPDTVMGSIYKTADQLRELYNNAFKN